MYFMTRKQRCRQEVDSWQPPIEASPSWLGHNNARVPPAWRPLPAHHVTTKTDVTDTENRNNHLSRRADKDVAASWSPNRRSLLSPASSRPSNGCLIILSCLQSNNELRIPVSRINNGRRATWMWLPVFLIVPPPPPMMMIIYTVKLLPFRA